MLVAGIGAAPWVPLASATVEHLIAASLLALGVGLAFAWRLPSKICVVLAGSFAFVHGIAHGTEQPGGSLLAYGAGLGLTTMMLIAAGDLGARLLEHRRAGGLLRWIGAAGAFCGLALLAGA
jgi:urease accessory protein